MRKLFLAAVVFSSNLALALPVPSKEQVDLGIQMSGDQGYGRTDQEAIADDLKQEDGLLHLTSLGHSYEQSGVASAYWEPQPVACGGRLNPRAMTAAHKSLPCGTRVRVTNVRNGRTVDVTINDRGPYVRGRIIDLTSGAFSQIASLSAGLAKVHIEVIGRGGSGKKKKSRRVQVAQDI